MKHKIKACTIFYSEKFENYHVSSVYFRFIMFNVTEVNAIKLRRNLSRKTVLFKLIYKVFNVHYL